MEASVIETKLFSTASEMLSYLRLSNEHWWQESDTETAAWVFRGHSDANFHLVPSGLRLLNEQSDNPREIERIKLFKMVDRCYQPKVPNLLPNHDKQQLENEVRREVWSSYLMEGAAGFLDLCFKRGVIEQEVISGRPSKGVPLIGYAGEWPWTAVLKKVMEAEPVGFSLAQHHGTPTLMLDWTRNPIVAAYFACESNSEQDIAIWAFCNDNFNQIRYNNANQIDGPICRQAFGSGLIKIPPSRNGFLQAQDGVLTSISSRFDASKDRWLGAEEIVASLQSQPPFLKKLILQASEVPKLKEMIRREGVSRASLMPTIDSIALTVRNSWS